MNKIHFINIDLEVESSSDITPIIQEWGERICVLRYEQVDGIYYGSFETGCSGVKEIIDEYVFLIEILSESSRFIWDKVEKKYFDFGYESGVEPNNFHSEINLESLKKIAAVGANVIVTIYPIMNLE